MKNHLIMVLKQDAKTMNVNVYEIPPMNEDEKFFLMSNGISPELIGLYKKVRETILAYGMIEVRATRDYIVFKHPYGKSGTKIGTLANIFFKDKHLELAFNMYSDELPEDPKNLLIKSRRGVCNFYVKIKEGDNLFNLKPLIRQAIYRMSHVHRVVKINGVFETI